MAISFPLPEPWDSQGWRLKIRDKERVEPPHVSLMRKTQTWRFNLRDGAFMDHHPDPAEVPKELMELLSQQIENYRTAWDAMYPKNPVGISKNEI